MIFAGVDVGAATAKTVILSDDRIVSYSIIPTGYDVKLAAQQVTIEAIARAGISKSLDELDYVVSTGYARNAVAFADKSTTEIICHAKGAHFMMPGTRTIIDIGGQDSKAIEVDEEGNVRDFVMNDKCAAGTGRFLEIIADALGIKIEEMGEIGLQGNNPAKISNICTVFAEQEVVARLAEGVSLHDLVAGILESLANRVSRMVNRLRVAEEVVVTGGGAKNMGLVKALSDKLGYTVSVPPEPLLTGAIGAALLGKDIADKALHDGVSLETKERSLKEIKIF
jgi:predicted CoA-substrate-specific enzyme activase